MSNGVESRNGGCVTSMGWQGIPHGCTTVAEGLFPKVGPGQGKMGTSCGGLSGVMTVSG